MLCPKCGSPIPDDGFFCGCCGKDIRTHIPEEPAATPSAPVSADAAFARAMDLGEETGSPNLTSVEAVAVAEDLAPAPEGTDTEEKDALPVFSGKKKGVTKAYDSRVAAPKVPENREDVISEPPMAEPVKPVAPGTVYKPVMPAVAGFNWKKLLAVILVLALIVGGISWIVEADLFSGSSNSRKDRDDDDDDDRDEDEDDDHHGHNAAPSGRACYSCSGLNLYLPDSFEVGYAYEDSLYCYTDTYHVEVACGYMADVDSSIRNASDFADYYEYEISGYYDYERSTKNGVPYILIYDEAYDQTLVYGFYVSDGYGWLTAAYCYGEGDVNSLISYATSGEIDSVPQNADSYDDYYDDEDDYDDDSYYEDDYYAEDYFDCSGCMNGRCGICMGDGDYAGVECQGCEGSGQCGLCDGLGIIFY